MYICSYVHVFPAIRNDCYKIEEICHKKEIEIPFTVRAYWIFRCRIFQHKIYVFLLVVVMTFFGLFRMCTKSSNSSA